MSSKATREVYVLAPFQDKTGTDHAKGDVFTVAYETDRQRTEVNEMIHRGFLTLDVAGARRFAEATQSRGKRARKQGGR